MLPQLNQQHISPQQGTVPPRPQHPIPLQSESPPKRTTPNLPQQASVPQQQHEAQQNWTHAGQSPDPSQNSAANRGEDEQHISPQQGTVPPKLVQQHPVQMQSESPTQRTAPNLAQQAPVLQQQQPGAQQNLTGVGQNPDQSKKSVVLLEPSVGNLDADADIEEIRKLEQEFEKKLQRAKKSYGTRMDNLHRSKEEAEAQHRHTLEKHEKERIEFEKRVRLAEEEQTRRLNQIQKDYEEKRKAAAATVSGCQQPQHLPPKPQTPQQTPQPPNGDRPTDGTLARPPLHQGHKRSSSHADMSKQGNPALHHRNASETDLDVKKVTEQPPRSGNGLPAPPLPPPRLPGP